MIVEDLSRGEAAAELGLAYAGFGRFSRADTPLRAHPELDEWICRRILAGMRPQAIVAATGERISLRTAYRWTASLLGLEVVRLGGYQATFALRRGAAPTRITDWRSDQ